MICDNWEIICFDDLCCNLVPIYFCTKDPSDHHHLDRTPCESMMLHSSGKTRFFKRGGYPLLSYLGSLTTKSFTGRIWRQKSVFFVDANGTKKRDMNDQPCHAFLSHSRIVHVSSNILQYLLIRGFPIFPFRAISCWSNYFPFAWIYPDRSNAQNVPKNVHKKQWFLPPYPPRETFCCQTAKGWE